MRVSGTMSLTGSARTRSERALPYSSVSKNSRPSVWWPPLEGVDGAPVSDAVQAGNAVAFVLTDGSKAARADEQEECRSRACIYGQECEVE